MPTLFEFFGKTKQELIDQGWNINGLAIFRGHCAYAEGNGACADGVCAYSGGQNAYAYGNHAVAKGIRAFAHGDFAIAIGNRAVAEGWCALAEGDDVRCQSVCGN